MKVNEFDFDVLAERIKTLKVDQTATINLSSKLTDSEWDYGIKVINVLDWTLVAFGTVGACVKTHSFNFDDEIEEALMQIRYELQQDIIDNCEALLSADMEDIEITIG